MPAHGGKYDACELLRLGHTHPRKILIEQGSSGQFLAEQLLTDHFREAAIGAGQPHEIRMQDGYDHSYYFIGTFIASHIAFHAQEIAANAPIRVL